MPADDAEKLREVMKAQGHDPEKPGIDARLIKFLCDNGDSSHAG